MNNISADNRDSISVSPLMKYRNYHLWMLIPFFISILGFSYSYYMKLAEATFHQHVHAISATAWYILVMVQPYLIVRKQKIQKHRELGIIALLVAGMVAGSAFAIIPKNIDDVARLKVDGFYNPTIAYFVTVLDFILVSMFIVSVALAIRSIKRKDLSGHVQWLMASVFFVLSPALLRMMGIGAIMLNKGSIEGITMVKMAIPTMIGMLALILLFFYKFGSFKHLSFRLLVLCQLLCLFVKQIGDNESVRSILTAIFKV